MSDDDYSSLSDLGSDVDDVSMAGPESDYENTPKSRSRRKTKKTKGAGYTIKNALKAPRATTYTAQALFDQIVSGDIDLDPEYQRGTLRAAHDVHLQLLTDLYSAPQRRRLARSQTDWTYRLPLQKLLYSSRYLL